MYRTVKKLLFRPKVRKINLCDRQFLSCRSCLNCVSFSAREIKVKLLSDPEVIFKHCAYKTVNYEDPNLNISMPIFSIHGNHDDPSKNHSIYLLDITFM